MAETPSSKPTDSFSWTAVTNGTSEPSSGRRIAGWAPGDAPPATEFNWWWQKLGATLEWLRANAVRRFGSLHEAIAATEEGEVFVIAHAWLPLGEARDEVLTDQGWTTWGMATDGVRIYVASDHATGAIKAYPATPGTSVTPTWAITGQAIDPLDMSSDGIHVAIANGITGSPTPKSVVVYDATDGSLVYSDASTGYCYAVACGGRDSAANPRVWWGTHNGGTANTIYRWNGTSRSVFEGSLRDIKAIAAGGGLLIAAYSLDGTKPGIKCWSISDDSSGGTALFEATVTADPSRSQGVATDGERVYWVVTGASGVEDHRLLAYGLTGELLWTATLGDVALVRSRVRVDDRYVYVTWYSTGAEAVAVMDKQTGAVLAIHNPTDTVAALKNGAWCIDGSCIWMSLDGETFILARGTSRQPTLWRRRAESPEQMMPTPLMAQPLGGSR